MNKEGKVVVIVNERILVNKETGQFAARYDAMRLTAFGKTRDEAITKLKKLFKNEINYFREKGLLEKRLNKLGVKWCWESECTNELPYQDTSRQVSGWEYAMSEKKGEALVVRAA